MHYEKHLQCKQSTSSILENGLQLPTINVDAFTITYLNQGVTLTSDLQVRSSFEAREYALSVLSKLFKPSMRHHSNNIRLDKLDSLKCLC